MPYNKELLNEITKHVNDKKTIVLKDLKGYQLPVQAHTSNNAKLAIGFSLVASVVALTAVTAMVAHKVLYRKLPEYRSAFDTRAVEAEKWVDEKAEDVVHIVAEGKKKATKAVDATVAKVLKPKETKKKTK